MNSDDFNGKQEIHDEKPEDGAKSYPHKEKEIIEKLINSGTQ